MIVREVRKEDVLNVLALGVEFAEISKESHGFSINKGKIYNFINTVVNDKNWIGLVLVDDNIIKGFLAGIVNTTFFSDDIYAQEVVWYVKDFCREGMMLMVEFEKIALLNNCKRIVMGYKPKFLDMKEIYERRGYNLMECYYVKDICQQ